MNPKAWLRRFGLVAAILALYIFFACFKPEQMFNPQFFLTLMRQISINGLLALGVTFVLLTGGVDLSIGSMVALCGVVAATFARAEPAVFQLTLPFYGETAPLTIPVLPLAVPILLGVFAGALCGSVNGGLVTKGRVAPFIVTLGMMTAARGLAYIFSDGRPVSRLQPEFNAIGSGAFLGLPLPFYIFAAAGILSAVFLYQTRSGRHLYATGGNEEAARAAGINVHRVKILAYTLCGAFAGMGGVVQAARSTSGVPTTGVMYELDAIAAVVIGGTSLAGGIGGIGGTLLGVLLMGLLNSGLDMLNVSPYYQQIVKGAIIVGAVWLDQRGKGRNE